MRFQYLDMFFSCHTSFGSLLKAIDEQKHDFVVHEAFFAITQPIQSEKTVGRTQTLAYTKTTRGNQ